MIKMQLAHMGIKMPGETAPFKAAPPSRVSYPMLLHITLRISGLAGINPFHPVARL